MNKHRVTIFQLLSFLLLPLIAPAVLAQSYQKSVASVAPVTSVASVAQFGQSNRTARFRWEGIVDGTSIIHVRRRQVQTEVRSGLPVQRQRYDFSDPLPTTRINLQLDVIEGRGRVQLTEEPRQNNDYTATVRIDDPDRGQSRYVFELRWYDLDQRDDRRNDRRDDRRDDEWRRYRDLESFSWRGRVDDESIIRISGNDVRVETIRGYGVSNDRSNFSSPLPRQPIQVNLVDAEGRGEIVLVEQPNPRNNFTAGVRIRDRDGGAGTYAFTITWVQRSNDRPRDDDRPRYDDRDRGRGGSVRWSGRVDGRDVIHIRGNQLWIEHQAGGQIADANYRFESPLPNDQRTVSVRKLDGRGTVRVIEQPSRLNNFTAKILIDDENGGADRYDLEISW